METEPWSFADPDASWWRGGTDPPAGTDPHGAADQPDGAQADRPRHPRRRPPRNAPATGGTGTLLPPGYQRAGEQHAGPAAEAHAAAARDVAGELDPAIKQRAGEVTAEPPRTDSAGAERDHDQPDPYRYDPLRPPAGPAAQQTADTVAADEPAAVEPVEEPDVMVLPEPSTRNRPTVALDRGPVPGPPRQSPPQPLPRHPGEPLPRPTGDAATDARLEKLENSPFWLDEHERPAELVLPDAPAHVATGSRRSPRHATRRPAPALFALVALALVASFFAWVSAEPFWLAVGHGDPGYATTTACTGSGVTQRCIGQFTAADGRFAVTRVTLLGVSAANRAAGSVAPARMVSPGSRQAYLGDTGLLVQLRWVLGFALVLICGYAIAGLTGARRLAHARARRAAVLASLTGPLLLLAGFLFAAY